MKTIFDILRGVVIGLANIIPGVSGGTMMVSMGIYDTIIGCINSLFKDFKRCVKMLWPYALGMVLGILGLAKLITFLLGSYPLPTNMAFIGLILGGLPMILKKMKGEKKGAPGAIAFVLAFALVVGLKIVGGGNSADASITLGLGQMIILFVIGVIAAATMVIPGVSGSMMLMLLGYYTPILNAVNDLKDALFSANFAAAVHPLLTLLPFGVGVVLGIFGIAKAIEWLMAKCPTPTYCGVLGLVLASPVAILLNPDIRWDSVGQIIAGVVTFAVGFAAAMLLSHMGKEEKAK